MAASTPTEKSLRLILQELKSTRIVQGKLVAEVRELSKNMAGMQVALSERERDISARYDELGQRAQNAHDRLTKVERALKLRSA